MEGWVPIVFLMFVLKIPVGLLLYLVWWAFHAHDAPEEAPDSGSEEREDHHFRRFRRDPKRPRGPRRGGPAPDCVPVPEPRHESRVHALVAQGVPHDPRVSRT